MAISALQRTRSGLPERSLGTWRTTLVCIREGRSYDAVVWLEIVLTRCARTSVLPVCVRACSDQCVEQTGNMIPSICLSLCVFVCVCDAFNTLSVCVPNIFIYRNATNHAVAGATTLSPDTEPHGRSRNHISYGRRRRSIRRAEIQCCWIMKRPPHKTSWGRKKKTRFSCARVKLSDAMCAGYVVLAAATNGFSVLLLVVDGGGQLVLCCSAHHA